MIEHHIAQSSIHGLGVFAKVNCRKGDKIWEFNASVDLVIPLSSLENLPNHVRAMIRKRAEFYPDENIFILGADGDAFMNHSDSPNLLNDGRNGFAARDIEVGDEITCDYRSTKVIDFPLYEESSAFE